MSKNKQKILALLILLVLIVFGVFKNTQRNNILKKNGVETNCIITGYNFVYKSTYNLSYEFTVNSQDYVGNESVSAFECDSGIKGCVGESFKVIYDKNNPKLSEIDLGKYNSFKEKRPSL